MRISKLVLAMSIFGASNAMAQTQPNYMGEVVGNILTANYGAAGTMEMRMKADGSYVVSTVSGQGPSHVGHWLADGNYVCWIALKSIPRVGSADKAVVIPPDEAIRCEQNPFVGRKVGDKWDFVDRDKQTVKLSISKPAN